MKIIDQENYTGSGVKDFIDSMIQCKIQLGVPLFLFPSL
jgi:hypothetical protein